MNTIAEVSRCYARQTPLHAGLGLDVRLLREDDDARFAPITRVLRTSERQCNNVPLLDVESILWEGGSYYGKCDGVPLYYEEDHLCERGNRALVPLLREAVHPEEPRDTDR